MSERLQDIAAAMMAPGKGLLAADESTGTIKKRFDTIGLESTADSRRDYREMLFRSDEAMKGCISGVILFDETLRQQARDGTQFVDLIRSSGAIPGIKVDAGAKPMPGYPGETVTEGLDGLDGSSRSITNWVRVSPSGAASSTSPTACRPGVRSRPMPMRWPAMRRCARPTASCRSSSRKF